MNIAPDYLDAAAAGYAPRKRRYDSPGHLARTLDPQTRTSDALDLIDNAIVRLARTSEHDALAVFLPPQEGKSQKCSRRTPEWLLDYDSSLRVGIVSYQEDIAVRWGRDIKRDIALARAGELRITIRQDSSAAGRWDTPDGGGCYCVGIGGPLAGRPLDWLIIDDPVKDRAAAESETIRDSTWDWWESVGLTRLAPRGRVLLISTRWHQDDLAGRILARPGPLRWRVISIPAIATDKDDPLGRAPGEEMQSVRGRAPGYFRLLQATMSHYTFSGLYQQTPTAAEGNVFRRQKFKYWRRMEPWPDGRERIDCEGQPVTLADCWIFGTVDVAASEKTSAHFTVVSAWAVTPSGDLILLDRRRKRAEMADHFALARPLIDRWPGMVLYVEKSFFSTTLVRDARAAGYPIAEMVADTDKLTRALPAAGRVHAQKVWFPAETSGCECGQCAAQGGEWLDEWIDELVVFPSGTNDDQVDTLSYAALVVTNQWTPAKPPQRGQVSASQQAIDLAAASATGRAGNGSGDLDIMNVQY